MSSMRNALLSLRWQPTLQFVRYRKVNIQNPFPPHFVRAKIEHICKPFFPRNKKFDPETPLYETCTVNEKKFEKQKVENMYITLVARDLLNWFNHSKLIAFFHVNPLTADEEYEFRLGMKRLQMKVKLHGKEIISETVAGTKYEPILRLYQSHTAVAFGPESDVKGLIKLSKKNQKFILLGAVVEDRLMSRAELEYYATIPDLQSAQASLLAVLNSAAQGVVRQLNQHQSTLVQHLQTHVDINSKKEPS